MIRLNMFEGELRIDDNGTNTSNNYRYLFLDDDFTSTTNYMKVCDNMVKKKHFLFRMNT